MIIFQDDPKEFEQCNPWLLVILGAVALWCHSRKLRCCVTSIVRPLNDGISESKTHQEGRAIDLSVKGFTQEQIEELAAYINDKFKFCGAISSKTMKPVTCLYHNNGNGWHFHIQVRPLALIKGALPCF